MSEIASEPTLEPVKCIPILSKERATANLIENRKRGLPNFLGLPEVGKRKNTPIAIVAGGPSLKSRLDQVRKFRVVMAAATVHDYLVERGIHPRYAVLFDPCLYADNDQAKGSNIDGYYDHLSDTCTYLIASHCEAAVLDKFTDVPVALWHPAGDVEDSVLNGEGAITGGCTAALRAAIMAILLGYWDIHFFGLDSSYLGDESHAYTSDTPLHPRVQVKIDGDKEFDTNIAWVAQAQQFFTLLQLHQNKFRATVHGEGLIPEMFRYAARPKPGTGAVKGS